MVWGWDKQKRPSRADRGIDEGIEVITHAPDYLEHVEGFPLTVQVQSQPILSTKSINKVMRQGVMPVIDPGAEERGGPQLDSLLSFEIVRVASQHVIQS